MLNRVWILLPILAVSALLAGHGAAYGLLPVAPSSSTYTTGDGTLVVEFSEPVTMVDYTKLYIRDAGRSSIDIVLADVSDKTHDTDTMTFTLDSDQRTAFDTMLIPYLAVDHAAVHGQFDNPILEGYHILTVHDTEPPGFASAAYHTGQGMITITFDEAVFIPDYSKMHIRDSGNSTGGITLVGVDATYQNRLDILFVTLNASQRTAFGDLTAPELDIDAGAVRDESDNPIVATSDQTIVIDDTTAPLVESVTYDTNLGMLLITFDEPVTTLNYSKIHIRDSGNSTGGITFFSLARLDHTADTVSALLNANEKVTFHGLSIPQLDVDADATSDPSNNSMVDQNDIPITINDTARPSFESARYSTSDHVLSITFSENVTVGNSTVLRIHDINHDVASGISFGTDNLSTSGNMVNATLSASQMNKINGMHAPRLDIDAGVVSDDSDNPIRSAKNLEIIIDDAVPPALVHAKYFTGDSTISLTFSTHVDNGMNYSKIRMHDSGSPISIQFDSFPLRYIDHNVVIIDFDRDGGIIESMTAPQLDIDAGAVSEDDHILNTNRAAANLTINVHDTTPPEFDSATYTTGNGTLTVRFNEPISLLNYAKLRIHDSTASIRGISLADVATIGHAVDTVTARLSPLQRTAFETMNVPLLEIDTSAEYETAAAYDISVNAVLPGNYTVNVSDTSPPEFVSVAYNTGQKTISITFDEPVTAPNYSKMHIRNSSESTGGITLDSITMRHVSQNNIKVTLDGSQRD